MGPIDPNKLRLKRRLGEGTMPEAVRSLPHHKKGEKFLKGPIPLTWLSATAQLPGKSLHVGIVLWFLAGLKKSRSICLPNKLLGIFGVSRNAKYRALMWLEGAKLVNIKRRENRNPLVTLLDAPEEED